jgi:diguanylate cyclase (GGDEF)-like protein/PAS domain S-box-containing protein
MLPAFVRKCHRVALEKMTSIAAIESFLRSRSGRAFAFHLAICGVLSAAVGVGSYYSSLNWFVEHKSEEKVTALRLVDAFVTTYSSLRSQFGSSAPVPSTFRAKSIEAFAKQVGGDDVFRLRWVGRPGREIKTGPTDASMAATIEAFALSAAPKPKSEFLTSDGQVLFRTVYPSFAREESCVACHNKLQPGAQWRVNDLMGAFAIDVPASPFLRTNLLQSAGLGLGLFAALGLVGFFISRQHFRQIAERETAAAEIGRARKFLDTVVQNIPAVVTVKDIDSEKYLLANRSAEGLFGIAREDIIGKRLHDVFPHDVADLLRARDREAMQLGGLAIVDERSVHTADAETRIFNTKKLLIPGEAGEPRYLLTLSEDITQRKQAEAQIAFLAKHDPLTHLPNRAAFTEQLTAALAQAHSSGENFAVLCVDLDRFKEINDVFGRPVGDALLREAAKRLQAAAWGAIVARIGGDEFTLISTGETQIATAETLADRLHEAFAADFEVGGQQLRMSLSVGIAIYPTDGADETALIANADAALYRAKAEGRGKTSFFDIAMDARLHERRALQLELRSALSRNEFSLVYQPQSQLNGETVGMEALARWRNPTRGAVPPGTFIPLAEESGLIIPLGEWILREACREAASWPRPLGIAVNISPIQFRHGDLPGLVLSVLMETGLAANRLELEITEGVLVEDFSRAVSILSRLKALGIRIAMDDFGTGYSSLSYLQSFPFDKIKIDQSFISDVGTNLQSAAIVRAVIGLARGLKLPVLAEGVESEDQLAFLTREGCDEVQGYFLGRPYPIDHYAGMVGRARDERSVRAVG